MARTFKDRIKAVGRLRVAKAAKIPYGTLTGKINGFIAWGSGEMEMVESIVSRFENDIKKAKAKTA